MSTPPITVHSLEELEKAHAEQHKPRRGGTTNFREFLSSTLNLGGYDLGLRSALLNTISGDSRDINGECGYPTWLTPAHYAAMYDRFGLAKRVVHCEPEESWAMDPEVYEEESADKETEFESAWVALLKQYDFWHFLCRVDILSGIGQFGILLFGLDDGKPLYEPVEGIDEDGTGEASGELKILYLRAFSEEVVFVKTRERDVSNPRYGLPTMYTLQFRDFPNWGSAGGETIAKDVHWTRVLHVADNRKMSEVFGTPRMQEVYNLLYDLQKTHGAAGEAFWKNGLQALAFEVNPEIADQGIEMDTEGIKEEMKAFQAGLQRYLALQGVSAKTIAPTVVDPTASVECALKSIAISKSVPYRVLFGSEEAKLASGQDARAWLKRVARRQAKYLTPMVIRPFIDRLIQFGLLPQPEEYFVEWPDLNSPTDQDKATVALTKTQAITAYVQSGGAQLMDPRSFLTLILGMTMEEADSVLEGAEKFADEQEAEWEAEQAKQAAQEQPVEGEEVPSEQEPVEAPVTTPA